MLQKTKFQFWYRWRRDICTFIARTIRMHCACTCWSINSQWPDKWIENIFTKIQSTHWCMEKMRQCRWQTSNYYVNVILFMFGYINHSIHTFFLLLQMQHQRGCLHCRSLSQLYANNCTESKLPKISIRLYQSYSTEMRRLNHFLRILSTCFELYLKEINKADKNA